MREFHKLQIRDIREETKDARRLLLDVPDELRNAFRFQAGQHLPLSVESDGRELRRTYSICSAPGELPLELGVRIQDGGQFSDKVLASLSPGDSIRAMPPAGRFCAGTSSDNAQRYAGFAAGSGITPILAMIRAVLRDEPSSHFTLFYGNRAQDTTMFIEDLFALKNRHPERLQLQFVFSREEQEFPIAAGRLDGAKTRELIEHFFRQSLPDAAFICGPDTMIDDVAQALGELGMDADVVHAERFGAPRKEAVKPQVDEQASGSSITVIIDGHRKHFDMQAEDTNIVDAAASQGIDLPFSCKGGVCATCRTHVQRGEVEMALNYGLEPWEVEAGFVLACQSTPKTDEVVLDYDKA